MVNAIYCFICGFKIEATADLIGVSRKTVRTIYLQLRERLLRPEFRRWHSVNVEPLYDARDSIETSRFWYAAAFAKCSERTICARNFRLGHRKERMCRGCYLRGSIEAERIPDVMTLLDSIHAFYEHIGLRNDDMAHPVFWIRRRVAHFEMVVAVMKASGKGKDKAVIDHKDMSALGCGTLINTFIADLIKDPLPSTDKLPDLRIAPEVTIY